MKSSVVFQSELDCFEPLYDVVGVFCQIQDEFLFLLRHPHSSSPNCWGTPGGKVQKGKSVSQAAIREMREETGIQLDDLKFLGKVFVRYPHGDFSYHMFSTVGGGIAIPHLRDFLLHDHRDVVAAAS